MSKLHRVDAEHLAFHCPGCGCVHIVRHAGPNPVWGWNGSMDKPTFNPAIHANYGNTNPEAPVCHSFVRDGEILFLIDSRHKFAGQRVEVPDWES